MSGHSKWSTIKRKKAAEDAKRGKLFTKLAREIELAARLGGPDPEANFRLRLAVDKAKSYNMPKDNIDRAIRRGAGLEKGAVYEEIVYEGYGPNGVAMIVEVLTDNRNRTVADVRRIFTRGGGNLGENGCVAWMFDRKGYITIPVGDRDPDELFELAVEAGAEDVVIGDDVVEIYTAADELAAVRDALTAQGLEVETAELSMVPKSTIALEPDAAIKTLNLIDALEELDDVQKVYTNLEITEELAAAYEQQG